MAAARPAAGAQPLSRALSRAARPPPTALQLSTALFYDGSFDTHAVRPSSAVSSDAGIEALFDSISYDKAGAIIFMLHDYLQRRRPGAFVKGLKAYLTEHEYGSASGADMWAHLGEASGLPVAAWVEPWFSQAGFPLIEVTTLSDGSAVLLQTGRFTQDLTRAQVAFGGRAGGGDQAERTLSWWVPVSYLTSVSPEVSVGEIGSASQFLSIPPTLKPRGGFDAEGADWLKVRRRNARSPPHSLRALTAALPPSSCAVRSTLRARATTESTTSRTCGRGSCRRRPSTGSRTRTWPT